MVVSGRKTIVRLPPLWVMREDEVGSPDWDALGLGSRSVGFYGMCQREEGDK